jgi:hypothetical protein
MRDESETAGNPVDAAKSSFSKIFTVGVIGWLVGSVIIFGLAWPLGRPDNAASAVLWAISHWWAAFAFGLVLLIGYALAIRASFSLAARAYVLPVALLAAIAWLCQMVYPDSAFRGDLYTYLPVVLIFYVFGCLWMLARSDKSEKPAFARAVIPGVLGGLVILGFVAVPVFASNAFRYRNAFQLVILKMELADGVVTGKGTLEINKPGSYQFTGPRYLCDELETLDESEPGVEIGDITWEAAEAPKVGAVGVFPFKVTWRKGMLPPHMKALPMSNDSIYLEVRDPAAENDLIYSLYAPVQKP